MHQATMWSWAGFTNASDNGLWEGWHKDCQVLRQRHTDITHLDINHSSALTFDK